MIHHKLTTTWRCDECPAAKPIEFPDTLWSALPDGHLEPPEGWVLNTSQPVFKVYCPECAPK